MSSFTLIPPEGVSLEEFLKESEQTEFNGIPLYTCNPNKNTRCNKQNCLWYGRGECFQTLQQKYSAQDAEKTALANLFVKHNLLRNVHVPLFIRDALSENNEEFMHST